MITKLLIIALLPVKYIHADDTTTLKPDNFKASTSLFEIRRPNVTWDSERRPTSVIFPNKPVNDELSELHLRARSNRTEGDFQLSEDLSKSYTQYNAEKMTGQPIIRNWTHAQNSFVANNTTGGVFQQQTKHEQQSGYEGKEKTMEFIDFESDTNSFDAKKLNGDENTSIQDKKINSSPSLNAIFGTLFPENIAVMFRSSYGTDQPNSKQQVTVEEGRTLDTGESKTISIVAAAPSIPTPLQIQRLPPSAAYVNATNGINLRHMSREDIDNINNAEMSSSSSSKQKNENQNSSSFLEGMSTDNRNENDYEDVYPNVNGDNLIGSSMKVSNQLLHPSFNPIQDHTGSGSRPETQVNLKIIPDEPESYDEKLSSSPARQLDEFQEQVEKQFNPNDARIQTEASSRNFLKSFKEGTPRAWQKYRNEISTNLQPIQPDSLLHTYIHSSQSKNNTPSNSHSQSSIAPPYPNGREDVKAQYQPMSAQPKSFPQPYNNTSEVQSYLDFTSRPQYNKLVSTLLRQQTQPVHGTQQDNQASENQEAKEISALHTDVFSSNLQSDMYITHRPLDEIDSYKDSDFEVEIQKSVNTHNKFITEYNGNLIEQHEIYARPEIDGRSAALSDHPIRVEHVDETHQSIITVEPDDVPPQQRHQPERQREMKEELSDSHNVPEKPPHPMEHIVEKEVRIPYPVKEFVEKIVPVETFVERSVPIPYPVQVNHFVDRPYAVQVPVAVAVPIPIHRYVDRPYAVEKIVEKPIHVPYPVERVVEKIVERHVPVEVEKIVEKPIEKIVKKFVDRPYPEKQIIVHPIHIPVPVGIPVELERTKSRDSVKKPVAHTSKDSVDNLVELVPPPLSAVSGQLGYKTLPENIDILLLDDNYEQVPEGNQYFQWSQLAKRDAKSQYIKRSPKLGRISRVEYGFKPPIVPSLEIDMQGMPVAEKQSSN